MRLQAFYRGFQARKLLKQRRAAALRIQACIRGYTARRYCRKLKAAIFIQKHVRRFLVQRIVQAQIRAAVVIQVSTLHQDSVITESALLADFLESLCLQPCCLNWVPVWMCWASDCRAADRAQLDAFQHAFSTSHHCLAKQFSGPTQNWLRQGKQHAC